MTILLMNLSHCTLKRKMVSDAIKHATEAVKLEPENIKAHYRLALAYKENTEFEKSKN